MNRWRTSAALSVVLLAFVAAGLLFASHLGIEADESSVANCIYPHGAPLYSWTIGGQQLPIMLYNYVGALKSWMYNLLFQLTPPRPIVLRLPTLLMAAAAIWLFFVLLDRTLGRRAAWIGALLLATDTSYLLLNTADFGAVSVQFILKMAALMLLLNFYQRGSKWALAGGFFLLGLALWDKAVFIWVLFGLALAVVAVFPRELRRLLTLTNIGIATAGIIVGALPLIAYNIVKPLDTFRSNGGAEPQLVLAKTEFLQHTMDGDILFGFINAKQPGPNPEEAHRWFQSLSISASRWTGHPHHNLTVWAFVACVIALPLLWRTARKPLLFGVAVCIGTWVFIAVTASTGANAHHPILLWPFHFLVIAAALSRLRLFPAAAATALLCGSNLLATNQLYADLIHNGPAPRWTDAMDPLESYLQSLNGVQIIAADWGFAETMNLLSEGQLPMYFADTSGEGAILAAIGEPHNIFVAFARPISFHPEVLAAIQAVARRENYSQERLTTIHDRSGRPTFDVFRYRKLP